MKSNHPIQVLGGDLKPMLIGLSKVIPRNESHPIFRQVKVSSHGRKAIQLNAARSDFQLDLTVRARIEDSFDPFLVPLTDLRGLAGKAKPRDTIALGAISKTAISEAQEFPDPDSLRTAVIKLPDQVVSSLLNAFACASGDDSRYILKSAKIDASRSGKGTVRIVGTDGRHLFRSADHSVPRLRSSVILPDHKLWRWKPLAVSRPWTLQVGAQQSGLRPFQLTGPFWTIHGRTVQGNYPDYRQVIPDSKATRVRIRLPEPITHAVIRQISELPGKKLANRPVGILLEKETLTLLARERFGQSWSRFPIGKVEVTGQPEAPVFINRDFLHKALRFGLTEIGIIDETAAVQFCQEGNVLIAMPLRNNDPYDPPNEARRPPPTKKKATKRRLHPRKFLPNQNPNHNPRWIRSNRLRRSWLKPKRLSVWRPVDFVPPMRP